MQPIGVDRGQHKEILVFDDLLVQEMNDLLDALGTRLSRKGLGAYSNCSTAASSPLFLRCPVQPERKRAS